MDKKEYEERVKMVKAMEYIARQINDESIFDAWLMCGVADGDIPYGQLGDVDTDYFYDGADEYVDDECFSELMGTFISVISMVAIDGGLCCGGIASKSID